MAEIPLRGRICFTDFSISGDFALMRVGSSGSGRANHQKLGREPARRADSFPMAPLACAPLPQACISSRKAPEDPQHPCHSFRFLHRTFGKHCQSTGSSGVILLSVGLSLHVPGAARSPLAWYQDAKVIWSIVIWATYVGVVSSRYLWRFGGALAWALIACFVFLILTFSGTNLMSEMHQ